MKKRVISEICNLATESCTSKIIPVIEESEVKTLAQISELREEIKHLALLTNNNNLTISEVQKTLQTLINDTVQLRRESNFSSS